MSSEIDDIASNIKSLFKFKPTELETKVMKYIAENGASYWGDWQKAIGIRDSQVDTIIWGLYGEGMIDNEGISPHWELTDKGKAYMESRKMNIDRLKETLDKLLGEENDNTIVTGGADWTWFLENRTIQVRVFPNGDAELVFPFDKQQKHQLVETLLKVINE